MIRIGVICSVLAVGAWGCRGGDFEVRIDEKQGVKPVRGGFTSNDLSDFKCGDTIEDNGHTIQTRDLGGACEFLFEEEIQALTEEDYQRIDEFADAAQLINRVEIKINRLDIEDENGNTLDLTRVRDADLWVNGQQVVDIDKVKRLPIVVTLEGEPLNVLKRAIDQRAPCTIHVKARVVLKDTLPKRVSCQYDGQPAYVLSSAEL